jgi:hypothetical protein
MSHPSLNPASQQWGREVTASVNGMSKSLSDAQRAAALSDKDLQASITRATNVALRAETINLYIASLAIVNTDSRTQAIGV